MLSPFLGFVQSDIVGVFKAGAVMASGLALMLDTTDASPLTPSFYGNSFGTVKAATLTATSGPARETGFLLQPVSTNGPSVFSVLASIYDESVAAGTNAAVLLSKSGAMIATDQYATGAATGAIKFDGTVALETACGINAGMARVAQTTAPADTVRLVFKGQVTQRNTALAVFQIV